jgi:hypothetical protein
MGLRAADLHKCLSRAYPGSLAAMPTCAGQCRSVRVSRVLDTSRTRTCVVPVLGTARPAATAQAPRSQASAQPPATAGNTTRKTPPGSRQPSTNAPVFPDRPPRRHDHSLLINGSTPAWITTPAAGHPCQAARPEHGRVPGCRRSPFRPGRYIRPSAGGDDFPDHTVWAQRNQTRKNLNHPRPQ